MAHKLLGEATQAIFAPQTLRKQREQVGNQLAILVVPPPIAVKILFNFCARGRHDDFGDDRRSRPPIFPALAQMPGRQSRAAVVAAPTTPSGLTQIHSPPPLTPSARETTA